MAGQGEKISRFGQTLSALLTALCQCLFGERTGSRLAETIMGLLNPVIAAIFAAIFLVLWRRQPDQVSALAFGISHILIGVGFLTFHLTPDPDAAEWSLLMHAIYCASTGLVVWGAAKRVGQNVSVLALIAIALIAAGLMYFGSFGTDMNARLMAANSCYGLMLALGAQVVGRAEKAGAGDHVIFWLLAITAAPTRVHSTHFVFDFTMLNSLFTS